MRNIEIKVRCDDLDAVEARLAEQGCPLVTHMRQVDTYFTTPTGRLKLREIDGATTEIIGYQRTDLPAARTSNYELARVADGQALRAVLAAVLPVHVVVAKMRDLYRLEDTRIHLDDVDGLGTFVELETAVYGSEHLAAERQCARLFATLALDPEDVVGPSYADLMAAHSRV